MGGLPVNSVKNEKKQLFHQIDWLIVKTVDPMTSLHADTDVARELGHDLCYLKSSNWTCFGV